MSSNSIPIYQLSKVYCYVDYLTTNNNNNNSNNNNNNNGIPNYLPYIFEITSDGYLQLTNAQAKSNIVITLKKIMIQAKEANSSVRAQFNPQPPQPPSSGKGKPPVPISTEGLIVSELLMYCQGINGQRLLVHILTTERTYEEILRALKEVSEDNNIESVLAIRSGGATYNNNNTATTLPPGKAFIPTLGGFPDNPHSRVAPHEDLETAINSGLISEGSVIESQHLQPPYQQDGPNAEDIILYSNEKMHFSAIRERNYRFAITWKPWAKRTVQIHSNGILTYAPRKSHYKDIPRHKQFNIREIDVTLMADEESDDVDYGVIVKCHTLDNIETYFRCIVDEQELDKFLTVLRDVATVSHNIDNLVRNQLTVEKKKKRFYWARSKQSVMRRAVTRAMDKFDLRSKRDRIISKRGTMKWLPVSGANDLIHGSWWFVWGSVGAVVTSVVVLQNKTHLIWNDDDSTLTTVDYEATWILMCISGIFSTLGSLFFVRAFHENPPMSPMFPQYYHIQSDELLASWLFFLATLPFVPYCFIYLMEANFQGLSYIVALILSIVATAGTILFARACYPTEVDKPHRDLLMPLSGWLCFCCCSRKSREHYFMNDWLGGSWCFFWGTAVATFGTLILFFISIGEKNPLHMFMYGTSLAEMLMFLLGSAYFVAGSYPEGYAESYSSIKGSEGGSSHHQHVSEHDRQLQPPQLHQEVLTYNPIVASGEVGNNNHNNYDQADMEGMEEGQQGTKNSDKQPVLYWKSRKQGHEALPTYDESI